MVAWRPPPSLPVDRLLELTYLAEQSHFWFRGFRRYMKPALARATAGVPAPRILDCGCGTGSNLDMLKPYGRAIGFDLTRIGVAFAREHGHRVVQASIGQIPFATGSFDLVTSFDVFQCLPDPVERDAIEEVSRVLRRGGWLLLHVAALAILHGRHSVLSEEVRRYTPSRLRSIVERSGFRVLDLQVDHVFPYRIREYVQYRYMREPYFQLMPDPLFRAFERRFGWHLLVNAEAPT